MAILGNFYQDGDKIIGQIITLTLNTELTFTPATKNNHKSPNYRVYAHGVEIGAAWSKVKDKNVYYSVLLDDPSFPAAVHCSLVPAKGGYHLIWTR